MDPKALEPVIAGSSGLLIFLIFDFFGIDIFWASPIIGIVGRYSPIFVRWGIRKCKN